jgi:hypothetical protein
VPIIPVSPCGSGCSSRDRGEAKEEEDEVLLSVVATLAAATSGWNISTKICTGGNPALVPGYSSSYTTVKVSSLLCL